MRSTDSIVTLISTLALYLFFVNFETLRVIGIVLFSLVFGWYVSQDEWRTGRAIIRSILPLIFSVVLLFVASLLWSVLQSKTNSVSTLLAPMAYGFFVLLFLALLLGVPLASIGIFIRRFRLVRSDA